MKESSPKTTSSRASNNGIIRIKWWAREVIASSAWIILFFQFFISDPINARV
jgi:hypothetical protein